MYNIAIITSKREIFQEMDTHFSDNDYKVNYFDLEDIEKSYKKLGGFDFICFNLEFNDLINHHAIVNINKETKVPLYIFGMAHTELEKVLFLEAGAEGYIEIPFSVIEVFGRINAVLKYLTKLTNKISHKLIFGPIKIDLINHNIQNDHKTHPLTKVEYKIIKILLDNKDQTVTKDRIINYVWRNDKSATDNALGIHISRLRKKIEHQSSTPLIETVWGIGYRLNYKLCDANSE